MKSESSWYSELLQKSDAIWEKKKYKGPLSEEPRQIQDGFSIFEALIYYVY